MNQCIHCRLSIPGMRLIVLFQNIGILGKSTAENKIHGSEQHKGHKAARSLKPTFGKK